MPELPEVETIRSGLARTTTNCSVESCAVLLARTIAFPDVITFQEALAGQVFGAWRRRGKYLYCQLSAGILVIHLRMTGQLKWNCQEQPVSKHTRVRFWFVGGKELRFDDQRTFGQMWWVPPDRSISSIVTAWQSLGVEPLGTDFTVEYLQRKLQNKQQAIKSALLDQTIVAGIGNIYADESLFLAGIHPQRACHSLTAAEIVKLHQAIIQSLQAGLRYGGTTFSSYLDSNGERGNYLTVAWVFRRTGQPCRVCGTPIERLKIGGRSSHLCPTCQPIHQDLSSI
ncbi:MAG: DNA-formamidopyrimidine glycosylase [Pseudanabaenaceae cyanobacterium SKYGB_i_bin29]|nr:DNA-formamidopyrimidine glycosylase [Pseudanabaenaceae cyanobacterium SKYG29]MDW8420418.1 DNA-formamidopyrimidine glycosylase [Pseudanabaenaceae cyanobacterium SKYGB_i_bin29]